ncbi:MAG: DUF4129 domain-containing protein, partial [Clostridia bacterium]|nr:DUF4129 domain-containing protein [Clostridia bacterium]
AWMALFAAGLAPLPGETARQHLRRAGESLPDAAGAFSLLAARYDRERYGPADAGQAPAAVRAAEARMARAALADLRRAFARRLGRLRVLAIEWEARRAAGSAASRAARPGDGRLSA